MSMPIRTHHALLLALLCSATGCAQSRNPLTWFRPTSPQDAAIQAMVTDQQSAARQVKTGKESSLYPPEIVQQEPLPRTEKDLKNPLHLHLSYARLQEQIGNLTEARSSYEKVVNGIPESVEANLGLARLDALAGKHQEAEARYRGLISSAPNSHETHYAFGQYLAEQKRHTEAIVEIQKAVKMHPQNTQYRYSLGIEMARIEQYPEAVQMLSQSVSRAEAAYNVGYIALMENGDRYTAERYLSEALQHDSNLDAARYWLTEIKKEEPAGRTQILTASASQPVEKPAGEKQPVINAVANRRAEQSESQFLMPATSPPGVRPEDLTPEQWEQWQNQTRLR